MGGRLGGGLGGGLGAFRDAVRWVKGAEVVGYKQNRRGALRLRGGADGYFRSGGYSQNSASKRKKYFAGGVGPPGMVQVVTPSAVG